jgi:hypothetical protein
VLYASRRRAWLFSGGGCQLNPRKGGDP